MNIGKTKEELEFSMNKDLATKILIHAAKYGNVRSEKDIRVIDFYANKALEPYFKHTGVSKQQLDDNSSVKKQIRSILVGLVGVYEKKKSQVIKCFPNVYDENQNINLDEMIRSIQESSRDFIQFKENIKLGRGYAGKFEKVDLFKFLSSPNRIKDLLKASEDKFYLFDVSIYNALETYFVEEDISRDDYLNDTEKREMYREILQRKVNLLRGDNHEDVSNAVIEAQLSASCVNWVVTKNALGSISKEAEQSFKDTIPFNDYVLWDEQRQRNLCNKYLDERRNHDIRKITEEIRDLERISDEYKENMEKIDVEVGKIRASSTLRNTRELEEMFADEKGSVSNNSEKMTK